MAWVQQSVYTLCVSDEVICAGNLRQYEDNIAGYVNRCPDAWGVIYQADVRTRTEHAPRVLEKCLEDHAKALRHNWDSSFNPAKPWDEVWRRILHEEQSWWFDVIEIPFQNLVPANNTKATPTKFFGTDALTRSMASFA